MAKRRPPKRPTLQIIEGGKGTSGKKTRLGRPFKKGDQNPAHAKNRQRTGSGRGKGTPNKITSDLRQAILDALNDPRVGGREWLVRLANKDMRSMSNLFGKLIPSKFQLTPDPEDAARSVQQQMAAMEKATAAKPDEEKEK